MVRDRDHQIVSCNYTSQETGSNVNLNLREYHWDDVDLSVKTPGGQLNMRRIFFDGKWRLGPGMTHMSDPGVGNLIYFNFGDVTTAVVKDGVVYKFDGAIERRTETNSSGKVISSSCLPKGNSDAFFGESGKIKKDRW